MTTVPPESPVSNRKVLRGPGTAWPLSRYVGALLDLFPDVTVDEIVGELQAEADARGRQ